MPRRLTRGRAGAAAVAALAALAIVPALAQPQAPPAAWEEQAYNPKPAEGDFLLPMPCGGKMAFRPVETPGGAGLIADLRVPLGSDDAELNFVEFVRNDFVAGGFYDAARKTRFYYLGKYEVTQDQHAAVLGSECKPPTQPGRRPAVQLGWFDAVQFAHQYSAWLSKNARESLPREGEAMAFVRLPTEAEWEYAARGGRSVSEVDFRQRLFPMSEPPNRYIWSQGSQSAAGQIRPAGLLQPNPLGLHDVLGNAAEIVMEPFRVNFGDRLHGHAGGFVAKGGDYLTPLARIRTSMRIEYRHFNAEDGAPVRLPMIGMRMAVAMPVLTDQQRIEQLRKSWTETLDQQRLRVEGDALQLVDALGKRLTAADQKEALERIKASITADRFARNVAEREAVRSVIEAAAVLVRSLRDYDLRAKQLEATYKRTVANPDLSAQEKAQLARYQEFIETLSSNRDTSFDAYAALVLQAGDRTAPALLEQELGVWQSARQAENLKALRAFGQLFVKQTLAYRRTRNPDKQAMLSELINFVPP